MRITFEHDKIFMTFPFSWDTVDRVKSMGIMTWEPKKKIWHCQDNALHREIIGSAFPDTGLGKIRAEIANEAVLNPILMNHQRDGVITAFKQRRWAYWYDTGTGKTLMALEIIRHLNVKTLIITPLAIIKNAWIDDCAKFYPDMRICNLWERNKKTAALDFREKFNIVNYELFRNLAKKYNLAKAGFRCIILDESAKVKNHSTESFKEIVKLTDNAEYFFSLTATPAPNSIQEYWTQMRMLNPSKWGKSFHKWKTKHFVQSGYGGFKWEVRDAETEQQLLADVAGVSSSVLKEDVLDLPDRTFNIRAVTLSSAERKAHRQMAKDLYISISEDDGITAANAAVKIGKLRQITAGFCIDTETGTHADIGSSKLNELSDLLDEIGKNQVIIWTQYQYEAVRIAKMFDEQSRTFGICNGTVSQAKQQTAITDFKSGKLQYLIAHPASIGHGITLVNCSYAVYFSRSYSYEQQYQSQDRIYRYGQKNVCTYYFLDAENSIDGIIREAVNEKKQLNEVFLNAMRNMS